jgi:hypothetical protein
MIAAYGGASTRPPRRSAAATASSVDATLKYAGGVGGDRHAAEVADVARRHHHRPRDVTGATRG